MEWRKRLLSIYDIKYKINIDWQHDHCKAKIRAVGSQRRNRAKETLAPPCGVLRTTSPHKCGSQETLASVASVASVVENHLARLLTNVAAKKNNHSLMDIEHFLRIRQIGKQSANFVRFCDTSQFWPWCGGLACVYLIDFLHVTGSHIARLTHYNALIGTFAMMRSTSGDWSGHEKEATIVPLFPVWGILTEDSLKKENCIFLSKIPFCTSEPCKTGL